MKSEMLSCTAAAQCSTANLGPGFDVFGLGLDAFEDLVTITRSSDKLGEINVRISGENCERIPSRTSDNSAGLVIKKMSKDFYIDYSLDVDVIKRVPTGFGLGSSAASAAAAAIAFDKLFNLNLHKTKLVEFSAEGEIASAGIKHYDNVAASIFGGFVIVKKLPKLEVINVDPPRGLVLVVAVPIITIPERKTEVSRRVLPREVSLENVVHNVANASFVVAGFVLQDIEIIAKGIDDIIVEPARMHLVPGFIEVKKNALGAGALAVTISGAGPSMISFLKGEKAAKSVAKAMEAGYKEAGLQCRTIICHPSHGSRIIDIK